MRAVFLVGLTLPALLPSVAFSLCVADPLGGTWVNENPNARSVVRFSFEQICNDVIGIPCDESGCHPPPPDPTVGRIRVFGSCSPSACDWNWTNLVSATPWKRGTYNQGFAARTVQVRSLGADRAELVVSTRFTDGSGRSPYEMRDTFRRFALNYEYDVDRPGRDYRNFDLPTADHHLCGQACAADSACRAFTYVPPGVQGPSARCWLKNSVPGATRHGGMVSGVRR